VAVEDIPRRTLGRTGFAVSILGFGAMELRGGSPRRGEPVDPDQAEQVLAAALDAGINFIDTSIDYGTSEELIGRFVAGRRDEYFLASKCGCPLDPRKEPRNPITRRFVRRTPGPRPHVYTRANIVAGIDQTLRRTRTDHLDLLQVHMSPARSVLETECVVETLRDLQAQGKTRFIGSSATIPNLDDHIDMGVFDAFQIPYSAVEPEHGDGMRKAATAGAGVIVRGGVAKGVPAGGRGRPGHSERWSRMGVDDLGIPAMELILRYTLSHPATHTTIVGTRNPDHLAANIAAARKGPLPDDVLAEVDRRVAAVGPPR
jgi:aryl-alcohol dehydrogenase-like predicted oxidoreductase